MLIINITNIIKINYYISKIYYTNKLKEIK